MAQTQTPKPRPATEVQKYPAPVPEGPVYEPQGPCPPPATTGKLMQPPTGPQPGQRGFQGAVD